MVKLLLSVTVRVLRASRQDQAQAARPASWSCRFDGAPSPSQPSSSEVLSVSTFHRPASCRKIRMNSGSSVTAPR